MSRGALKADDVTGFLTAAHDELADTILRYQVEVEVHIDLGRVRGQLTYVAVAYCTRDSGRREEYARANRVWPTARYTSLHALLYALTMSLNIAVQRAYHDEHGHFLGDAPA